MRSAMELHDLNQAFSACFEPGVNMQPDQYDGKGNNDL